MEVPKVYESEYRFCCILWAHEPIKSSELVALCQQNLGWKPTTTYTVIKKLSRRGILKNEQTMVTSLFSQEQVQRAEMDELLSKRFDGSLPAFVAAFASGRKLSQKDIDQMQSLIDRCKEEISHE